MKKYEVVIDWVKRAIDIGDIVPGQKLPSESELMAKFDVSRNVVRQALGGLINQGLITSQHGVGTFCKRRVSGASFLIGVVCLRISSYIFPRIIHGCNTVLQREGYNLLLNESRYDLGQEAEIIRMLQKKNVDGVIITPVQGQEPCNNNAELLWELEKNNIPVVLLDNEFPDHHFTSVVLDDYGAGRKVAEFLWSNGHRDFGIIYSSNYRPKTLRKNGARDLIETLGGRIPDECIVSIEGQTSTAKTYRQIRSFFKTSKELPTAMICSSDDEALMFMYQAEIHGINVPKDVSVISFDNSDIARMSRPKLTTVDHPSEYMGETATKLLLDRIHRKDFPLSSKTIIESTVIRRNSVVKIG